MSLKVVVSLMMLSLVAAASAQDWCNIQSCKRGGHVHSLCKFPNPGPPPSCHDLGGGLSTADKANIVDKHNELRQKVARGDEKRGLHNRGQPRAKSGSMPNLQWDDTLAAIAQRWADQCNYAHDPCPDVPTYQVGQNIAHRWTPGDVSRLDMLSVIQSWYDEVEHFDANGVRGFRPIKAANGQFVGHYTQMVWAKTTKIGCGLRRYHKNRQNHLFLVCNYGPSGNVDGWAIYEA